MLATNISNGFSAIWEEYLFEKYKTVLEHSADVAGFRLAVTHNDRGLDKADSNALSSPCAQRAKAHQEH